ncbi:MAG: TIGR03118 family protein [Alphaproteobacteria bacterium]|jgi:uncharacterized protein (TIGR03118 family)
MFPKIGVAFAAALAVAGALSAAANPKPADSAYEAVYLVSNQAGLAANYDPELKNAWGVSHAPGGPLWVSSNGRNASTIYDRSSGAKVPLTVRITHGGAPTGQVYVPQDEDGELDFPIRKNGMKGPSLFIFVTEEGTIEGWNPDVDPDHALLGADHSAQGAAYKGVAIARNKERLYAADFANNQVEIFNDRFQQIGAFTDPDLPNRFAPFNVAHLNGEFYVAFAKREKDGDDEVAGPGLGYVDVFDFSGHLKKRLIANGPLNAPWGMALAPQDFGAFSGALLVGNFGNGRINAFNRDTGEFLGMLTTRNGAPIRIDGLWALDTGPGNRVTFAAGPNDEADGLVGYIQPASTAVPSR